VTRHVPTPTATVLEIELAQNFGVPRRGTTEANSNLARQVDPAALLCTGLARGWPVFECVVSGEASRGAFPEARGLAACRHLAASVRSSSGPLTTGSSHSRSGHSASAA
jgi:hypothetical protein